ncbi:3-phosphoshikimate 1-carboxyvinyltransferase [Actinospongicola halichondriae]|uniref:3-phosphoshikimate 1-carboxyvinyltransferase n=1 Tax=Actinospongicola halichondriae TaxID=3236844 RepID=UPI003D49E58F
MTTQDPKSIERSGPVDATVTIPGSKSITNRALVCAALAGSPSVIDGWLDADDTRAMIAALETLGVAVGVGEHLSIGSDGPRPEVVSIDARQSGTTSRFLLPVLALDGAPRRITGDEQLQVRPMGEAFEALRALGARVSEEGVPGFLPAVVEGPLRGGEVELAGDVSSQFVSGLLLAAPQMPGGLRVWISTELISRPYVDMTVAVMRSFGASVTVEDDRQWVVDALRYEGAEYTVEPDASAASYAWGAAVVTGGAVTVPGLHRSSLQGDVAFVDVLEQMGARVRWDDDAVTVAAGPTLRGVDVDLSQISDTVPTLAAIAALADGPTTIRGVGFIRNKETDRIAAPVTELRRCGVDASETDDGMVIVPGPVAPTVVETYDDHRMAMGFSLLGLVNDGIQIAGPDCVTKTFPGYWDLLDRLRVGSEPSARAV